MKIFSVFCLCLGLGLLISCSNETQSYPVGSDFISNSINVKVVDTFSINTGTFKLDSLITSSTNRILVGTVNDDNLGRLTSRSYFQVYNSDFSIADDAVYDSIGLVLSYDRYYYGDTTQVQTYKIHRLLETVVSDDDNFYNTSKLELDSEPLGEITFTPRPNQNDSIYIPLSKELGEEIFNKIKDNDINTSDDFTQYFKGITIVPDTLSNSHVLGFQFTSSSEADASSYMRLFFTEEDSDDNQDINEVIDFYIPSSDKQFNAINSDFNNSIFNGLLNDSKTTISSEQTSNTIYAQAGTGISAKIEIPSLKKLKELSNNSTALKSELTFSPLNNTKNLKDSLAVYVINNNNQIIAQLTDIDANVSYAVLNEDSDEFSQNTYYSVDMSGFVETILSSTYDLNYSIMIQFLEYNKTIDNIAIKDFNKDNNKIKLTVNYLSY